MVLSPVVTANGTDDGKITAPKIKALAVRTSSVTKDPDSNVHLASTGRGSELAEQLNEETKQKYVKGTLALTHLLFHAF